MTDFTMRAKHGFYELEPQNDSAMEYARDKWCEELCYNRRTILLPQFFADAAYCARNVCLDGFAVQWGEEIFPAGEIGAQGLYEASA